MAFTLKKLLPRSLLGRSLLILIIPVLLIQVVTVYVFFDRHWTKMTSRLTFAVAGEIAVVADQIEVDDTGDNVQAVSAYASRALDLLISFEEDGFLEEDQKDTTRNFTKESLLEETLSGAIRGQVRRPFTVDVDPHEKWVEVGVQLDNGLLHVSLPQRRLFSSSSYIFLLWMMGTSIIVLAIAMVFMRNQIRPIMRLAVAAERFGKGQDVPASFKPEGAREVRQAGRAFLEMHERIRRQIQQRTTMLAGVSHDLRTPLTRMKLQAAMLGQGPDVDALKGDIDDMERMIDAYLDFARGEGAEQAVRTALRDVLERIAVNAGRQGGVVEMDVPGDIILPLRPVAFERCLGNLIGNAAKYAGRIWIAAERRPGAVRLTIDDDGPGIPEDKYEEMFRPFVRGEPSRNPATGGVGLGLPIARDIIHGHGGDIWLEKSGRGGLRVVIELPD